MAVVAAAVERHLSTQKFKILQMLFMLLLMLSMLLLQHAFDGGWTGASR
ncbi:MAG: hypothetical protein LCI00_33725 [Chloroflexi bacterium]|nr:hypothetical protein [Chloroflexota bacterium]MCC6894306.1 hypothetical protein [Anaerolineae bacterium]